MTSSAETVNLRRMQPADVPAVAELHYDFFGRGERHGHSLANLGPEFLKEVFYGMNLDNPYLMVDVAESRGEMIAFSVYTTDWRRVSRFMLIHHPFGVCAGVVRSLWRRGPSVVQHLVGNLSYLTQRMPPEVAEIPASYLLVGLKDPSRARKFHEQTGRWVIGDLWDRMESTFTESGCREFWAAIGAHNAPANNLVRKKQMRQVATAPVQGLQSNFYVKALPTR